MCRLLYLNASVSDGQIQGNNGREWRRQMKIAEDLEEEWPSNSTVLGLLVFSPCKPIISIRQEDNYMQCFHPLAKKIKCLYFRTGCGFFDEMLFCQKTPVSDLFAVPPGGLSGSKFRLSRWNFWQTWCSWLKVWFSSLGRFSALHSQPLHKTCVWGGTGIGELPPLRWAPLASRLCSLLCSSVARGERCFSQFYPSL